MPLQSDEVDRISREVVRRYPDSPLEFLSVMSTEGGSGRVEVMLTVRGCHGQPCKLLLNLPRYDKATFEREFRRALDRALKEHTRVAFSSR
jgi:hypothetical protein